MIGKEITKEIELPEGIQASYSNKEMVMKGKKGEVKKKIFDPRIKIKTEGNKVTLSAQKPTKREKNKITNADLDINNANSDDNDPTIEGDNNSNIEANIIVDTLS